MATNSNAPVTLISDLSKLAQIEIYKDGSFTPPQGYTRVTDTNIIGDPRRLSNDKMGYKLDVLHGPQGQYIIIAKGTEPDPSTVYGNATLLADREILDGKLGSEIKPLAQTSAVVGELLDRIFGQNPNARVDVAGQSLAAAGLAYGLNQYFGDVTHPERLQYLDNVVGIGFSTPALMPSTLNTSSYLPFHFTTFAQEADPVVGVTKYNGGLLPGLTYYVDLGTNLYAAGGMILTGGDTTFGQNQLVSDGHQ